MRGHERLRNKMSSAKTNFTYPCTIVWEGQGRCSGPLGYEAKVYCIICGRPCCDSSTTKAGNAKIECSLCPAANERKAADISSVWSDATNSPVSIGSFWGHCNRIN